MWLDLKSPWKHISGCVYDGIFQKILADDGRHTFTVGGTIPWTGVQDQMKNKKRAKHQHSSLPAFCGCSDQWHMFPLLWFPTLMDPPLNCEPEETILKFPLLNILLRQEERRWLWYQWEDLSYCPSSLLLPWSILKMMAWSQKVCLALIGEYQLGSSYSLHDLDQELWPCSGWSAEAVHWKTKQRGCRLFKTNSSFSHVQAAASTIAALPLCTLSQELLPLPSTLLST